MSLAKKYGEIEFGEINNESFSQFSDSLETYFISDDITGKYNFLRDFGSIQFGEINNLLMNDFERALTRFIFR